MLRQALHQWFWDTYDYLGRLLTANVILFLVLAFSAWYSVRVVVQLTNPIGPAGQALGLFLLLVVAGPVWFTVWFAPVGYFGGLVSAEKDPGFREFKNGLRQAWARTWKWFQLLCLIVGTLFINLWFYLSGIDFNGSLRFLGYILAGLCFWLIIGLGAAAMAATPLVIRGELKPLTALKTGLLLALKFPGLLVGGFIFLVSLWIIGTYIKFAGILIFGFTGTVMLTNSIYDVLLEWERMEKRAIEMEAKGKKRPRNWKQMRAQEEEQEEERMDKERYDRTLRDLLRPWED